METGKEVTPSTKFLFQNGDLFYLVSKNGFVTHTFFRESQRLWSETREHMWMEIRTEENENGK